MITTKEIEAAYAVADNMEAHDTQALTDARETLDAAMEECRLDSIRYWQMEEARDALDAELDRRV